MNETFVLAIKEHRKLGYVFIPYVIEQRNLSYLTIIDAIIEKDIDNKYDYLPTLQKEIIRIIDEYSDNKLIRLFSKIKTISGSEFYQNLDEERINEVIRPYIEKRLVKIINLLQKSDIHVFYKPDNYGNLYPEDKILIASGKAETVFNFIYKKGNSKYFLSIKHNNKIVNLNGKNGLIICNNPCFLVLDGNLYQFEDIDGMKLKPFFTKEFIAIPQSAERKYFETFVKKSISNYDVKAEGFKIITENVNKKAVLVLDKDWKNHYSFILYFHYGETKFLWNNRNTLIVDLQEDGNTFVFRKTIRDQIWEQNIVKKLAEIGISLAPTGNFKINAKSNIDELQQYETINWLNNQKKHLEEAGIEFKQEILKKQFFIDKINLRFRVEERNDWFDIHAFVKFGEFEIPFIRLKKYLIQGIREFTLPNNEIAVIPEEWFTEYEQLMLFSEEENGYIKIKKHHYSLLSSSTFFNNNSKLPEKLEALLNDFKNLKHQSIPTCISATLRDYQKQGYAWLATLMENQLGACLADDMGLGKTLQTICLIAKSIEFYTEKTVKKSEPDRRFTNVQLDLFSQKTKESIKYNDGFKTCLIIVPTSLIHNWIDEFRKFAPTLKILKYTGPDREKLLIDFQKFDVVITSYGIIRLDIVKLISFKFLYLILDESQYIKNPDSKIYKAVNELSAINRLILTGTPIENSLNDLWAQLNFINKGLLGNLSFFKQRFINSIEKDNNEQQQQKLKQLIQPFILRRTKEQVAADLPPVTDQIIYCEMTEEQKSLYEKEKSVFRNHLLNINHSKQKNELAILQGIIRLRQIACHPSLLFPESNMESGKFEEVVRHIENLIAENHKVLIFSSFVKHLKLFADYFDSQKWNYSWLTGETMDRADVVKQFQNQIDIKIFLISIKAGGVGLNLTAADYVFILDPWWNPAVELQAISRAHRIGQDKNVMVYRFVSVGTIEEKIRKLQEEKATLAETFINTNNPLKAMSFSDMMDLV